MGKVLPCLSSREVDFILSQKVFFVGTAPLSSDGRVNISPKSPGSSLVVISPTKVAYADLTGSGAETAAHVRQNSRITILFLNLEKGPPKIVRLHGRGRVLPVDRVEKTLAERFPLEITTSPGFRAIFVVDVDRVSTSCGYSMPIMAFERHRSTLDEFVQKKGREGMEDYRLRKNSFSIDGLPTIASIFRDPDQPLVKPVHEDGYYFGQIVESGRHVLPEKARIGKQINLKKIDRIVRVNPWMFGAAMFVTGIVFGLTFAKI